MTENLSFGQEKSHAYPGLSEARNTQALQDLISDLERRFGDFPEVKKYIDGITEKIQHLQENNIDIPPALTKMLEGLPKGKVIPLKTIEAILSI